jgi:hypothetical protein
LISIYCALHTSFWVNDTSEGRTDGIVPGEKRELFDRNIEI